MLVLWNIVMMFIIVIISESIPIDWPNYSNNFLRDIHPILHKLSDPCLSWTHREESGPSNCTKLFPNISNKSLTLRNFNQPFITTNTVLTVDTTTNLISLTLILRQMYPNQFIDNNNLLISTTNQQTW